MTDNTTAPAPKSTKAPRGFALTALLVGIGAILFSKIAGPFAVILAIVAIVFGVLALLRKQPKAMTIVGLALAGVAMIMALSSGGGSTVESSSPAADMATVAASAPESASATPSAAPTSAAPAAPGVPTEYKTALKKAQSYNDLMHMSKAGLYDQLTSEYGEKYSPDAAQYAVDNVKADWNANALAKAHDYQDTMAMSPSAIWDQLTSEYGEKFTPEEADYAIANLN